MRPYGMAKWDCANLVQMGGDLVCLGITVAGLTDVKVKAHRLDGCLLGCKPMKPCAYFEKVVLPLADNPSPHQEAGLQRERSAARDVYWLSRKREDKVGVVGRVCPDCGEVLEVRKRYCFRCSRKRRLVGYRNRGRK